MKNTPHTILLAAIAAAVFITLPAVSADEAQTPSESPKPAGETGSQEAPDADLAALTTRAEAESAKKNPGEFIIPKSLVTRMYEAHDRARDKAIRKDVDTSPDTASRLIELGCKDARRKLKAARLAD